MEANNISYDSVGLELRCVYCGNKTINDDGQLSDKTLTRIEVSFSKNSDVAVLEEAKCKTCGSNVFVVRTQKEIDKPPQVNWKH